jgi:FKBP-type peptidyl-prolyl cis-trans isomerase FkpA
MAALSEQLDFAQNRAVLRGLSPVTSPVVMKIEKLIASNGAAPKTGDTVSVHYTGWLTNGTKFDSSVDRDEPFSFVLGQGQVIQGWDQGVASMRVGDKVRLTIPPDLAYGQRGYGL